MSQPITSHWKSHFFLSTICKTLHIAKGSTICVIIINPYSKIAPVFLSMTVMSITHKNVSMQIEQLNTQLPNTHAQNASFACENSIKNILCSNLTELSWRETLGIWPYKPGNYNLYFHYLINHWLPWRHVAPMEINFAIGSVYSRTIWEQISVGQGKKCYQIKGLPLRSCCLDSKLKGHICLLQARVDCKSSILLCWQTQLMDIVFLQVQWEDHVWFTGRTLSAVEWAI